jgi:hypothetical protein
VQEELSLVVHGAAREDLPVAHRRLEGRRRPELERLGRLHVVVAVDEDGLRAGRPAPFTEHDRVPRRLEDLRRQARGPHVRRQPLRRARHVGLVLGARADARDAEEREQLVVDARVVLREEGVEIAGNRGRHRGLVEEQVGPAGWVAHGLG